MQTLLLVAELFIAIALIVFVLLQRSEGGGLGMGASSGGGMGGLFSPRGLDPEPRKEHRGPEAGIEQYIQREKALVGAEASLPAYRPPRPRGLFPAPYLPEVVPEIPQIAQRQVGAHLARIDLAVGEERMSGGRQRAAGVLDQCAH